MNNQSTRGLNLIRIVAAGLLCLFAFAAALPALGEEVPGGDSVPGGDQVRIDNGPDGTDGAGTGSGTNDGPKGTDSVCTGTCANAGEAGKSGAPGMGRKGASSTTASAGTGPAQTASSDGSSTSGAKTSSKSSGAGNETDSSEIPVIILQPVAAAAQTTTSAPVEPSPSPNAEKEGTAALADAAKPAGSAGSPLRKTIGILAGIIAIASIASLLKQKKGLFN